MQEANRIRFSGQVCLSFSTETWSCSVLKIQIRTGFNRATHQVKAGMESPFRDSNYL